MTGGASGYASALRILGPPGIWALHFGALYASETVFCSWLEWREPILFGIAATAAAVLALAPFLLRPMREGTAGSATRFVDLSGMALALLSLCGVLWQTLPMLALPACVPPL